MAGKRVKREGKVSLEGYDLSVSVPDNLIRPLVEAAIEQTLQDDPPCILLHAATKSDIAFTLGIGAIGTSGGFGPAWQFSLWDLLRQGLEWGDEDAASIPDALRKLADKFERQQRLDEASVQAIIASTSKAGV